jgi:hypothetical protein
LRKQASNLYLGKVEELSRIFKKYMVAYNMKYIHNIYFLGV